MAAFSSEPFSPGGCFGCFLIMYLFYLIWLELFRVSVSYWLNFYGLPFSKNYSISCKFSYLLQVHLYYYFDGSRICLYTLFYSSYWKCFNSVFIFVSLSIYQFFYHFKEPALYISFCSVTFLFLISRISDLYYILFSTCFGCIFL